MELDVQTDSANDTVWLTKNQIALLYDRDRSVISRHINNIYAEKELSIKSTRAKNAHIPSTRSRSYESNIYNLDVIISVGYRVKSQKGIIFRKWANRILKEYLIKGYSINKKRLEVLNKTIEIQNKMLASSLDIDQETLVNVINQYTTALDILDDYDHQCLQKPKGNKTVYVLGYE